MAITLTYNYISGGGNGTALSDWFYDTPGAVAMTGFGGNDVYTVDNLGDVITENVGEGTDKVYSSISYTLGSNVENLILTNSGLIGTGNELDNVMVGTSGADTLVGGLGNDTYYANNRDTIIETGLTAGGIDTVVSDSNYNLTHFARSDASYDSIENITLIGNARNAIGNAADNTLTGNSLSNILNGKAGDDILNGGYGNDILFGDSGADTFVFNGPLNLGNRDVILDFNSGEGDSIQLSIETFGAIAPNAAISGGYITESAGLLYYDADGGAGLGAAFANITNLGAALTDADFAVV